NPNGQHVPLERAEHELARERELGAAPLGAAERIFRLQIHDPVEAGLAQHLAVAEEIDDPGADRGLLRAPAHAAREVLAGERERNTVERILAPSRASSAEAAAEPASAGGRLLGIRSRVRTALLG